MPTATRDAEHTIPSEGQWWSEAEVRAHEQRRAYDSPQNEAQPNSGFVGGIADAFTGDNAATSARNAERNRMYEQDLIAGLERRAPDQTWANVDPERWAAAQETDDYQLGESSGQSVEADPEAIAAERAALEQLQQMASQGGYTAADRARIREGQRSAGAYAGAQRGAIENQARARGMGGSGMELASLLGASQGGANMNAASTDAATRAGEARAFDALQMSGQLGSQMRGESFGEGTYRAEAHDARDVYNNEFLRQRAARNADREQQARQSNAGTGNAMAMANAEHQRQYAQQNYENARDIEQQRIDPARRQQQNAQQQQQQSQQQNSDTWGDIIKTVGTIAAVA